MKNFGMKEALASLRVARNNPGVSTGSTWLRSKGTRIESFSPVDGKLMGTVQATDERAYEKVVTQAGEAFQSWRTLSLIHISSPRDCS